MGDEVVGKLRDEVVKLQKARLDLLKWKLILVAGLGAAALGVASDNSRGLPVLFALISFVCLFVDMVCAYIDHRILVSAAFRPKRSHRTERSGQGVRGTLRALPG